MYDACKDRFRCWLVLRGRRLIHEDISSALGVRPDNVTIAGTVTTSEKGMSSPPLKDSTWCLDSAKHVSSNDPIAHLRWLVNTIEPKAVRTLANLDAVWITVFVETPREYVGFELPSEVVEFAAQLGAEFQQYVTVNRDPD